MRTNEKPTDVASRPRSTPMARLVLIAVAVAGGLAALAVGIPWLIVLTPRWLVRKAAIAFLWSLLAAVVVGVPAALVVGPWSALRAVRAHRRRDRPALVRALRWGLLAASGLVGFLAMEAGSGIVRRQSYRLPDLPTRFADAGDPRGSADPGATPRAGAPLYLVVVGESSARGEPYQPWISVGQVVGWQLERVFPGREVTVDVRADGGICLEQAVLRLADLERRPDALIVFAGHNEFQARYGWSRNVRHYVEEGPESPLALMELGRSTSSAVWLILSTLDRYYGETPPPPRATRELIDHPTCTPGEYAFLREDFHRRVDALAGYCRRIGTLPILILPASNDGAFEPDRSVLAGSTPAAAREAFAAAFRAARAAEAADPEAAIAAYRGLVAQHPEFAESHYRLARLLARAGAREEAARHFTLARDLDGLPLRCPGDFREAFRIAADRHGGLLIDGPALLAPLCPSGVPDDHVFHDAHHVNLAGTAALAQDVIEQLHRRRAFGWPDSTPAPRIDLEATARHFGMDAAKWSAVCERSAGFFARSAFVRHDPTERLELGDRNHRAALDLAAGRPLADPRLPCLDMPIAILRRAGAAPPGGLGPALSTESAGSAGK